MSGDDRIEMADWAKGIPLSAGDWGFGIWQPSPEVAEFWNGVERRELLLKHCPHCERMLHPKRIICPACGASDLGWRPASGRGKIYSFSEIHRAPSETFQGSAPYTVGLVALEEGVHLFTRFVGNRAAVAIDRPVRVDFQKLEMGQVMPVFVVA